MLEAVFGSSAAERVLLYMQNYEQGYGREIAATFGVAQSQVRKQLEKFESGGILVSRLVGRTRLYEWNPRNPLVPSLRALLSAVIDSLPSADRQRYLRRRTRPRRAGKAL
jgi:DNA-binding transcriptional ArsR family regulator